MSTINISSMIITIDISEITIDLLNAIQTLDVYKHHQRQSAEKWVITVLKENLNINISFSSSLLIDFPLAARVNKILPDLDMTLIGLVKLPSDIYDGVNSVFTTTEVDIRLTDLGTLLLDFKERK